MAGCIITVKVIQPGERAEEILAAVAERVHVQPSRQMAPEVAQFWFTSSPADEAWAAVSKALDQAGTDWHDHLLLREPGR